MGFYGRCSEGTVRASKEGGGRVCEVSTGWHVLLRFSGCVDMLPAIFFRCGTFHCVWCDDRSNQATG